MASYRIVQPPARSIEAHSYALVAELTPKHNFLKLRHMQKKMRCDVFMASTPNNFVLLAGIMESVNSVAFSGKTLERHKECTYPTSISLYNQHLKQKTTSRCKTEWLSLKKQSSNITDFILFNCRFICSSARLIHYRK